LNGREGLRVWPGHRAACHQRAQAKPAINKALAIRSANFDDKVDPDQLGRAAGGLPPPSKVAEKLREPHGVQHTVGRQAAFPSHLAPMHALELPNIMASGLMLMISVDQVLSPQDDLLSVIE
jgi:hypothetical protein